MNRKPRDPVDPPERRRPTWPWCGNLLIALWLIASPATLGYRAGALAVSDVVSGALVLGGTLLAWRRPWVAWLVAGVGLWVLTAPLVLWAPTAAAYNNGTLLGALIVVFAVILPHLDGSDVSGGVPPGWTYNPSDWIQRFPIVVLAVLGALLSRYMAAYQLGHIPTVWDPLFGDGTRRVLTSDISRAFPVSDAGLGAWSYVLDALAGLMGGRRRWRTMPWIVILFGLFIIPPGVTSIVLVMLQPIGVGEWCTLCLVASVIMLAMVPPAIDEVVATVQFLRRTRRAGGSWWRALWHGEGGAAEEPAPDGRRRSMAAEVVHAVELLSAPWNLGLVALLGAALMAAPSVLGLSGLAAGHHYIAGALVVTVAAVATAEPARVVRFLNLGIALWLVVAPWFLAGGTLLSCWSDVAVGLLLGALSLPRGRVDDRYGSWDRFIR